MAPRLCTCVSIAVAFTSAILLLASYRATSDFLLVTSQSGWTPKTSDNSLSLASHKGSSDGLPTKDYGLNDGANTASRLAPSTTNDGPPPVFHQESSDGLGELHHGLENEFTGRAVLVFASLVDADVSWVDEELGDLLGEHLGTMFYVTDDLSAELHTPANKGHEAMAYLTYMIDSYDSLPDISIFMHAHPEAWHNNYLLEMSSSLMVRHLNLGKVEREGYMNLRCHWHPGCPTHLNPMATEVDLTKIEELEIKEAWMALFPFDQLPETLAQPCCSQFAVTRERIRSIPRERYIHFRNWILESHWNDFITGRIFEYLWQYILNSSPTFCPDPRICYCDGYRVCFEDVKDYQKFFELAKEWQRLSNQLEAWQESTNVSELELDDDQGTGGFVQFAPEFESIDEGEEGEGINPNGDWDRGDWLKYHIDQVLVKMSESKQTAFAAGRDPARRSAALNAAQESPFQLPGGNLTWWT